jgi:hypothetical protein
VVSHQKAIFLLIPRSLLRGVFIGRCACPDFARAPEGLCKHRLARAFAIRMERTLQGAAEASRDASADEDPAWSSLATSRGEMSASEGPRDDEKAGRGKNASG